FLESLWIRYSRFESLPCDPGKETLLPSPPPVAFLYPAEDGKHRPERGRTNATRLVARSALRRLWGSTDVGPCDHRRSAGRKRASVRRVSRQRCVCLLRHACVADRPDHSCALFQ